jgi:hypothetical protein
MGLSKIGLTLTVISMTAYHIPADYPIANTDTCLYFHRKQPVIILLKECAMSIIGMILMWVLFAVFFALLSKWNMGGEYDRRQKYWARFEDK